MSQRNCGSHLGTTGKTPLEIGVSTKEEEHEMEIETESWSHHQNPESSLT